MHMDPFYTCTFIFILFMINISYELTAFWKKKNVCPMFYVPLENISAIWSHHHCWRSCELRSQPSPQNEVPLGVGIIRFVSFQYRWIFRTSIRSRDSLEKVKIAIWPPGDRWRFLQKCIYEIDRLVVTTFICTIFKHLMICLCIDSICDSVNL